VSWGVEDAMLCSTEGSVRRVYRLRLYSKTNLHIQTWQAICIEFLGVVLQKRLQDGLHVVIVSYVDQAPPAAQPLHVICPQIRRASLDVRAQEQRLRLRARCL
jgi:hypothetical protein